MQPDGTGTPVATQPLLKAFAWTTTDGSGDLIGVFFF